MDRNNLISISVPHVFVCEGRARLQANLIIGGVTKDVWFEVEECYGKYLCAERSDAFLIGVLNFAMRHRYDISCEAPVTAQLKYQIETYLIPSLTRNSKSLYATKIHAPIAEDPVSNVGGVGTGISCGVDSLHAVKTYSETHYRNLKLTHLVLNNVGAYWKGEDDHQYEWQVNNARRFCKKFGYELIVSNSNIAEQIKQSHLHSHTYSSCFAIYALQKLWRVYFYASLGPDFQECFSLVDNEKYDPAHYELLSLDVFSTRALKIYSEGGAVNKLDKIRIIADYPPAFEFLHVCDQDQGPNCGHCTKCLRTLTALDALGVLDRFSRVFDVCEYKQNRRRNLKWLCRQQILPGGDKMTRYAFALLQESIPSRIRIEVKCEEMVMKSRDLLRKIPFLKKIVKMLKDIMCVI